jgi:polyribonucleotide nucleotidyltransferase
MPPHAGPHRGQGEHQSPFQGEDASQTVTIEDDGSVSILQEATNRDDEAIEREITVEDDTDAGVDITVSGTNREGEEVSRTVSVDEGEDGGVDITSSFTNRDGEEVTRTVEIDEGEDGFVFTVTITDEDGEEEIIDDPRGGDRLAENLEELTVEDVVTAMLELQGVDTSGVDFSGIDDFAG